VVWDGENWEFEEDLIRSKFRYSNGRGGGRLLCGVILGWVVDLNLGLRGVYSLGSSPCLDSEKCLEALYDYPEREMDTRER